MINGIRERFASAMQAEQRADFGELSLREIEQRVHDGVGGISGVEAMAAELLSSSLSMIDIEGVSVDTAYLPRSLMCTIGRDLVTRGESIWRKDIGRLTWIDSYDYVRGQYEYNGNMITSDRVFHVKSCIDPMTGKGIAPLSQAKNLRTALRNTEKILAVESNLDSAVLMPTPVKAENYDEFRAKLKDNQNKGKLTLTESMRGGHGNRANARVGSEDWAQKRIGMDTPESVTRNYLALSDKAMGVLGVPLELPGGGGATSRTEAWHYYLLFTIEQAGLLIVEAAAAIGLDIEMNYARLSRFTTVGMARALQGFVAAGYDLDDAEALLGLIVPEESPNGANR